MPTWRVDYVFEKPESLTVEIFPSLIPRTRLESTKDTIRYLSRVLSEERLFRVITLSGLRGIGLVAISITVRP